MTLNLHATFDQFLFLIKISQWGTARKQTKNTLSQAQNKRNKNPSLNLCYDRRLSAVIMKKCWQSTPEDL